MLQCETFVTFDGGAEDFKILLHGLAGSRKLLLQQHGLDADGVAGGTFRESLNQQQLRAKLYSTTAAARWKQSQRNRLDVMLGRVSCSSCAAFRQLGRWDVKVERSNVVTEAVSVAESHVLLPSLCVAVRFYSVLLSYLLCHQPLPSKEPFFALSS